MGFWEAFLELYKDLSKCAAHLERAAKSMAERRERISSDGVMDEDALQLRPGTDCITSPILSHLEVKLRTMEPMEPLLMNKSSVDEGYLPSERKARHFFTGVTLNLGMEFDVATFHVMSPGKETFWWIWRLPDDAGSDGSATAAMAMAATAAFNDPDTFGTPLGDAFRSVGMERNHEMDDAMEIDETPGAACKSVADHGRRSSVSVTQLVLRR